MRLYLPEYDMAYYLKGALSGGICCSITHGGLTPVDVVKAGAGVWVNACEWPTCFG